jgi:hypothetical protein
MTLTQRYPRLHKIRQVAQDLQYDPQRSHLHLYAELVLLLDIGQVHHLEARQLAIILLRQGLLTHKDQSRLWPSPRYATEKKGKSVYQKNKILLVGASNLYQYHMR